MSIFGAHVEILVFYRKPIKLSFFLICNYNLINKVDISTVKLCIYLTDTPYKPTPSIKWMTQFVSDKCKLTLGCWTNSVCLSLLLLSPAGSPGPCSRYAHCLVVLTQPTSSALSVGIDLTSMFTHLLNRLLIQMSFFLDNIIY